MSPARMYSLEVSTAAQKSFFREAGADAAQGRERLAGIDENRGLRSTSKPVLHLPDPVLALVGHDDDLVFDVVESHDRGVEIHEHRGGRIEVPILPDQVGKTLQLPDHLIGKDPDGAAGEGRQVGVGRLLQAEETDGENPRTVLRRPGRGPRPGRSTVRCSPLPRPTPGGNLSGQRNPS